MIVLSGTVRWLAPRTVSASHSRIWVRSVAIVAIIATAAILRFAWIGSKSFWADEAYSAFIASHSATELVALTAHEDAHPPLYYLLLSLWGRSFGTEDATLRSLGALASVLTVAGTFWLGRRLGGTQVGTLAAFLTAVAPFQVLAAQEARMYSLLGLLTVLSWAVLLVAVEGNLWGWVGYVALTTLALYTHYFAFLVLLGQGVFVLAADARVRPRWLVSQLAIFVLYIPWLGKFFETIFSGRSWPFLRLPVKGEAMTAFLGLLSFGGHAFGFEGWFGGRTISIPAQAVILTPFLGLATIGVLSLRKDPRSLWCLVGYLFIPVVVAFAVSFRNNIFYPRYFSFVFPPWAILCAFGMLRVAMWVPPTFQRATVLTLSLAFLVVNTPVLHDLYTSPKYNVFDWRDTAALITKNAGPDDLIVIVPAFGKVPFARYFHGSQLILPMDPYELVDPRTGRARGNPSTDARNRALFRAYAARHEVLWIITDAGMPPTALERLGALLAGVYDLRGVTGFNAIRVYKTTRHAGGSN